MQPPSYLHVGLWSHMCSLSLSPYRNSGCPHQSLHIMAFVPLSPAYYSQSAILNGLSGFLAPSLLVELAQTVKTLTAVAKQEQRRKGLGVYVDGNEA